jgi:predicted MPP superfamily phosphohydrolase
VISRRGFLRGVGASLGSGFCVGGYALAVEPLRLAVTHYKITPAGWPGGLKLKIAALADIHACEPWMSAERIAQIADQTNRLGADLIVLLGDYAAKHRYVTQLVAPEAWAAALSDLRAPLGVHAVMGNHDWWDDRTAQREGRGPVIGRRALEKNGIPVYENDAVRLKKEGQPFWLAGLGDQLALRSGKRWGRRLTIGVDDLPATVAKVTDDAPVLLLAHEPDVFPKVPARIALTLSGHTHGGQVRLFGYAPVVPSRYGNRYAYGHVVEEGRHLIVSGGLGCSTIPVRLGMPPEIVVVDLGAWG